MESPTDTPTNSWHRLGQIGLVVLLAAGVYWIPMPLEGKRGDVRHAGIEVPEIGRADARLWQDPFAAVQKEERRRDEEEIKTKQAHSPLNITIHLSNGSKAVSLNRNGVANKTIPGKFAPCNFKACVESIFGLIDQNPPEVRVLVAMVSGGPFVGEEESRRRTRYAVLAGLERLGYSPDDAEHIHYVKFSLAQQADGGEASSRHLLPYEWLSYHSDKDKKVLVLWVNEDAVGYRESNLEVEGSGRDPEKGEGEKLPLINLLNALQDKSPNSRISIIGPYDSENAIFSGRACSESKLLGLPWVWYSPYATSEAFFTNSKAAYRNCLGPVRHLIFQDRTLLGELRKELMHRDLKAGDTVALVSQWDTKYSRGLLEEVKNWKVGVKNEKNPKPLKIESSFYLRGLDGVTARREPEKSGEAAHRVKADAPSEVVERPEGEAQIDYLRRLAGRLVLRDREVRLETGRGIRAVGILGNDYHDKLLVLKSLRQVLPEAVFFTTDLEAAMLHPGDNRYTRNLIVASSLGLELHPDLQGGLPPFRSSYQTETYLATLVAMQDEAVVGEELDKVFLSPENEPKGTAGQVRPLVFEIGRNRAVPLFGPISAGSYLGCGSEGRDNKIACLLRKDGWNSYPTTNTSLKAKVFLALSVIVGLALIALLFQIYRGGGIVGSPLNRVKLRHRRRLVLLGITVAGVMFVSVLILRGLPLPLDEPFSFTQGVSPWPSVILRFVAMILGIALFRRTIRRLRDSDQMVYREMGLARMHMHNRAAELFALYRRSQLSLGQLNNILNTKGPERRSEATVRKLNFVLPPALFRLWLRLRRRLIRINWRYVSGATLLHFGLVLAIGFALGLPLPPIRSDAFLYLNYGATYLAVVVFLALIYLVLDRSRRVHWLAERLNENVDGCWPHLPARGPREPAWISQRIHAEWMNLRLMAMTTKQLTSLVWYPALVFLLMLMAGSGLFVPWPASPAIYFAWGLSLILILYNTLWLRRIAESMRGALVEKIDHLQLQMLFKDDATYAGIRRLRDQVTSLNVGIFASLQDHPVVHATLTVIGGASGMALLDHFGGGTCNIAESRQDD